MCIVLAFSGGLDTSFCVPFLQESCKEEVITVTVNTGGFSEEELYDVEQRSRELGASRHIMTDGRADLFTDHISYLIKGNVLRGSVYPLCVGPERVVQAHHLVSAARELKASAIAHGSTGAGNDQVRFDVALGILARDIPMIAPIREHGFNRQYTTDFLTARGFAVPTQTTDYSINSGLWGTTIGGRETLTSNLPLPASAYVKTENPKDAPDAPACLDIDFQRGIPVALNGIRLSGVDLVEAVSESGNAHGIGRGMHVGDSILGIKGRVAFEAPAAEILISAHRELEKIVLGKWQRYQKDQLANFYGMLLHEAQYLDPVMPDIRAMIDSSQRRVSGTVHVELYKGRVSILGCGSPFSMFDKDVATYGESNSLWDGRDARGFTKIMGVQSVLAHLANAGEVPS